MKIIKLFLLVLFASISLEANYCIQVSTANKSEKNFLINQAKNSKYSQFEYVRIERRGNYMVFRIGDYNHYRDATDDMIDVRRMNKGAYIRKCDFIREKAVYIKDDNRNENIDYQEPYRNSYRNIPSQRTQRVREISKPKVQQHNIPKERYIQKKELTYTSKSSNNSLWGDCKKCFIPVYEEDDESSYKEEVKPTPVKVQQKRELRVEVPEPVESKKSFWVDDTYVKDTTPKRVKKRRSRNKFNIDEQFLP